MRVLVTGSQGFIGSYVVQELINQGFEVYGIDNNSKYHGLKRPQDSDIRFRFKEIDLISDKEVFWDYIVNEIQPHVIVMCAALVGGIKLLSESVYKLLDINNLITSNTFEAAIAGHKQKWLKRVINLSSSMVYENCSGVPTEADLVLPRTSYAIQKLVCEYYSRSAYDQYGVKYTNIRLSNCIGAGDDVSSNSHVIPDMIRKIMIERQDPLIIFGDGNQVRTFTHAKDIARAIRMCINNPNAINQTFNIASSVQTRILDLAKIIWEKLNPDKEFNYILSPAYESDTYSNLMNIQKAKDILGFEALIPLEVGIDEAIKAIC